MTELAAFVEGVSVIGPGLTDWPAAAQVLTGKVAYRAAPTNIPPLAVLPSAERRRAGRVVRIAIAAGLEASRHAGRDAATLPAVFASSGADGDTCHAICETLATALRQLSPTRFHNSVHNAPAGYWSIATSAMAASTTLCAFDASFAAGLLEALTQVAVCQQPLLLIACDAPYPEPLQQVRPLPDSFGMALLLAPARSEHSIARLSAQLVTEPFTRCTEPALETLRAELPPARCLPLLTHIARREAARVVVEYLGALGLCTRVEPC
jgi:hypothetical protein